MRFSLASAKPCADGTATEKRKESERIGLDAQASETALHQQDHRHQKQVNARDIAALHPLEPEIGIRLVEIGDCPQRDRTDSAHVRNRPEIPHNLQRMRNERRDPQDCNYHQKPDMSRLALENRKNGEQQKCQYQREVSFRLQKRIGHGRSQRRQEFKPARFHHRAIQHPKTAVSKDLSLVPRAKGHKLPDGQRKRQQNREDRSDRAHRLPLRRREMSALRTISDILRRREIRLANRLSAPFARQSVKTSFVIFHFSSENHNQGVLSTAEHYTKIGRLNWKIDLAAQLFDDFLHQ